MIGQNQAVPLVKWTDDTIRVRGSRVTLDSIVHAFKLGETAEQIQHSFPTLELREIYGAIYYFLENTEQVEEYPKQQREKEDEGRQFIETHFDTKDLREKILARRSHLVRR
jgi:uncharacterized protein (DUF433 family)